MGKGKDAFGEGRFGHYAEKVRSYPERGRAKPEDVMRAHASIHVRQADAAEMLAALGLPAFEPRCVACRAAP
jgi:hypothetical protein